MSRVYVRIEDNRWLIGNTESRTIEILIGVNSRKIDLNGINDLDICGSNEEKMSGIMQDSGGT